MNLKRFEQFFAFHCAPTLTGIKAANLITIPKNKFKNFTVLLNNYETCLRCRGISSITLSETSNFKVLLFYRHDVLAAILGDKQTQRLLASLGYQPSGTVIEQLAHLKLRLLIRKTFPHEIGIFLGYPLEDVVGFINNNGRNFKIDGYWKVYANIDETKKLFNQYAQCSQALCESLANGSTLHNLLIAN